LSSPEHGAAYPHMASPGGRLTVTWSQAGDEEHSSHHGGDGTGNWTSGNGIPGPQLLRWQSAP
jgi:hypothetical protein